MMIKNYKGWLKESENYFPADQWKPIDETLLDYFEVELDELVALGKPGISWSSESQTDLYRIVDKMVKEGKMQLDPTEEADQPWHRKTGESESGKKVHYYFFNKPFRTVVASIFEQRWRSNKDVDMSKVVGQIYVTRGTAKALEHDYRGQLIGKKYGL